MNKLLTLLITITTILIMHGTIYYKDKPQANRLCEQGIKLYKQKKNAQAKKLLERSLTMHKSGKTHYYLGNVLMNLHQFDKAVDHYQKSLDQNYRPFDSRYNMACAYSIKKDLFPCTAALLENLKAGDKKFWRIEKDKDLENFRNSDYYEAFFNIAKKYKKTVRADSAKTILPYLNDRDYYLDYDIPTALDPQTAGFSSDGTLRIVHDSVYVIYGKWRIDRKNKQVIFQKTKKIYCNKRTKLSGPPDNIPFNEFYLNNCTIYLDKSKKMFGLVVYHVFGNFNTFGEVPICYSVAKNDTLSDICYEE